MSAPIEVLTCGRSRKMREKDGWAFPRTVRNLLLEKTDGGTVLHLFGGKADFGTRLDIDPATNPDVIGDAWIPPFERDSFDFVVLDPPYVGGFANMSSWKILQLFAGASWIARRQVIWFNTIWVHSPARCRLDRAWLCVTGRSCAIRCLQFFNVPGPDRKLKPFRHFKRGPAIKYNRWLLPNARIPFLEDPAPAALLKFLEANG